MIDSEAPKIYPSQERQPHGFWISPYPLLNTCRYFANLLTNGYFSYLNPDLVNLPPLSCHSSLSSKGIKILFLGDIMVSKSGNPPCINEEVQKIMRVADIIVANVESAVVDSQEVKKRGLSLTFEMHAGYLKAIYKVNEKATWVFNIANNHACDASIAQTVKAIKKNIPKAEVIGTDVGEGKSVLELKDKGITIVGWTDVMNRDRKNYKKPVVRGEDITIEVLKRIKKGSFLIGFPHGNEEQSYYPLKATRDRWMSLMGKDGFDLIVGHGPHVVHPAEKTKEGLIFHSIGNFCSPTGPKQTKVGLMPLISVDGKKVCSRPYFVLQDKEYLAVKGLDDHWGALQSMAERVKKWFQIETTTEQQI